MPELPEVETIRRQLSPHLEGRTLEDVQVLDPRWTRPVAPELVERRLRGQQVQRLSRAGKYLIWELSGDLHVLMNLRMTGTVLLHPPVEPPHTRVRLLLDGGGLVIYVDSRRFGTGHLADGTAERAQYLEQRIGIEPMTPEFTAAHLRAMARGRTAPVKAFVLDQRRIAGVGNIYADEALFRAGIHPLRATGTLSRAQLEDLRGAIEEALQAGIEAKGATIDDFRHVDGARGSFQDRFLVHRREGMPCPRCGTTIRKLIVGGRGTYVCERCQPRPRARRVQAASSSESRPARSAARS